MAVGLMNGTRPVAQGPVIAGPPGEGWKVLGATDFNRDGFADVVWSNTTTNRWTVWLMDGTKVLAEGPELDGPPGDGWVISDFSDFNHDGLADLLWANEASNRVAVWLMNGTRVFAEGPEIPGPPGHGWHSAPGLDLNGDGMLDLLWHNRTANRFAVWLMNGTQVLARGPELEGPGEDWVISVASDCNGDGEDDIVWNEPLTNQFTVWFMDGTHVLAKGPVLSGPED
jgi:hypothetical protein